MPPTPPPAPAPAPPPPPPRRHKSVTFCSHARDLRYYSDPGRDFPAPPAPRRPAAEAADGDARYYSEPDAKNYFEIDYEFLKELRKIARSNCPKCRRRRSRKGGDGARRGRPRAARVPGRDDYVYCDGRSHSDDQHCRICCRVCNRSTDTLDSIDDDPPRNSAAARPARPARPTRPTRPARSARSESGPRRLPRERKNSAQSIKSVSFLESSNDESKEETNYTAKSFTNDLKKFLLKPSTPRRSLRDKFITSFKQEFEATKRSPKLKAIKGLWKSY